MKMLIAAVTALLLGGVVVVAIVAVMLLNPDALTACSQDGAVLNAANSPGLAGDCAILLDARDTLVGDVEGLNWSASRPIAGWAGITVGGSPPRVTGILLTGGLRGRIPPGLGRLTHLRSLRLHGNELTGEIPPELGSLTNLEELDLSNNRLTGPIPARVVRLNLSRLELAGNQFTGCLSLQLSAALRNAAPIGLPECVCPERGTPVRHGFEPLPTLGADGVPFMLHIASRAAGTHRITFELVVDLPEAGAFALGIKFRNEDGDIRVRIAEVGTSN